MTKTQGARNYNEAEQQHLLAIVAERLPLRKADWDGVGELYNRSKADQWEYRSAASLRRKFTCLCSRKKDCSDASSNLIEMAALELKLKISKRVQPTVRRHLHAPQPGPTENSTQRDQPVKAVSDGSGAPQQAVQSSSSCAAEYWDFVHSDSDQDIPTSTAPSLSDNHQQFPSSTAEGDADATPEIRASSPRPTSITNEATKPKQIHCDVIQLFLWFQRRDEQQLEHRQNMERQQKLEICAANRRQQELLECIASLKAKLTD